jgi:ABC-type transporter Mla subunit MlaD
VKLLDILRGLALVSLIALCVAASIVMVDVDRTVKQLHTTVFLLDKDLVDVKNVLVHVDLAANTAQLASKKEAKYLDAWNAGIATTLAGLNKDSSDLDSAFLTANQVLLTTDSTIKGLQPVENNAAAAIAQMGTATTDLDKLISDPQITSTIASVNTIAANTATTSQNVNATSKDIKDYVHQLTHPTWAQRAWSFTLNVAEHLPL